MSTHAVLSPSGAHRWLNCPGSVALAKGIDDSSSAYAEEGTAAHELAAKVLEGYANIGARGYVGMLMSNGVEVTDSMAEHVQEYVDYVSSFDKAPVFIEVAMSLSKITGEEGAKGTADAIVLKGKELIVIDLKFGMGELVSAEDNPQLMLYALAALRHFAALGDFETVRMVVHQPRVSSIPKEHVITIAELYDFAEVVSDVACSISQGDDTLAVGEKQCRWCKAKAKCPAIALKIQEDVGAMFEDIAENSVLNAPVPNELGKKMASVDLIEAWCKAVRTAVASALRAGEQVDGWKLVKGRKGDREWVDEERVVTLLGALGLTDAEIYTRKVVSPATVDKYFRTSSLTEAAAFERVKSLITQREAGLSVAKESDKRPPVKCDKTIDMFD